MQQVQSQWPSAASADLSDPSREARRHGWLASGATPATHTRKKDMSHPERFELTPDHIKLVRAMYIEHCDEAYDGAPAVNIKRPYGNSYVAGDVGELLGVKQDGDDCYLEATEERLLTIHRQTATALQIIVNTGCFEPGIYVRPCQYDTRKWVRSAD